MKLLKCNTCGKIYKVIEEISRVDYTNFKFTKYENYFVTDMNGEIDKYNDTIKCLNCGGYTKSTTFVERCYTPYDIMEVEDWVADLVFKVRGN